MKLQAAILIVFLSSMTAQALPPSTPTPAEAQRIIELPGQAR